MPNLDSLGESISWCKAARSATTRCSRLEQHIGRPVTRAPYPGSWAPSASRCSRATIWQNKHANRQNAQKAGPGPAQPAPAGEPSPAPTPSTFIGLDALDAFSYQQRTNVTCPFCANRCNRTVTFADGSSFCHGQPPFAW